MRTYPITFFQAGVLPTPTPTPTPTPYILDTYSVLEGYSVVRKLRSTSNFAFRVRRSLDNAETDIGFIGQNLDVNALTTFVGSSSGYIVRLYDQSGNNRHLGQDVLLFQPMIINAGTLLNNAGFPYINFDGSNDSLGGPTATDNSLPLYTYIVGASCPYTQNAPSHHIGGIRAPNWGWYSNNNQTFVVVGGIQYSINSSNTAPWGITINKHFNLFSNPASLQIFKNGTLNSTTYNSANPRRGGFGGPTLFYSGTFQEIIVFGSDVTAIHTDQRNYYNYY